MIMPPPYYGGNDPPRAIDEKANDQIMHGRRFGKANRTTYETLDPDAQVDVLVFDFLRVLFADCVLLRVDMALVGAPSV
jgi:hypothetical protein